MTSEVMQAFQAEQMAEERRHVEMIGHLWQLRNVANKAEKEATPLKERLKQYLTLNDLDELDDTELGVKAWIQERTGADELDLRSMAEQQPELVVKLALLGALRADPKLIKAHQEGAGTIETDRSTLAPYRLPGKTSQALMVGEIK